MHLVVNNVTCLAEVDRVDDFVVAVFFIAIEIFSLTTMTLRSLAKRNGEMTRMVNIPE